jgi:hypothetical protein
MTDTTPPAARPRQATAIAAVRSLLFLLPVVPVLGSVGALAGFWSPTGDGAIIALRARDVGTRHTPLLGMPSTVGLAAGEDVHHPGPLEMWWLAPFERLTDWPAVSLVALALITLGAVLAVLWWADRLGGLALLAAAAAAVATLLWSLRGEVLVTPFNPYAAVLPFGAYLVALVAAVRRVPWAGVAAVLLGSWAAQAHLSVAPPVLAAAAAAVAGAWLLGRSVGGEEVESATDRRQLLAGAVVLVLCWSGPALDVLTDAGGNVRAVLSSTGVLDGEVVGMRTAVHAAVNAVGWRPVWAQAGADIFDLRADPTLPVWLTAAAVLALATIGAWSSRRRSPAVTIAWGVTIAAFVSGSVLGARIPATMFNAFGLHNYLWFWPVSGLLWLLAGVGSAQVLGRWMGDPGGRTFAPTSRVVATVSVAVTGIVAAASLGQPHRAITLDDARYVRSLHPHLEAALSGDRSYQLAPTSFGTFGKALGLVYLLEMDGIEVVSPADQRRSVGSHRVRQDRPAGGTLHIVQGREPPAAPVAGARLVARHEPDAALLADLADAEDDLADRIIEDGWAPRLLALAGDAGVDDVRQWVQDEFFNLVSFRLVPPDLAGTPEAERVRALRRKPVLHIAAYLAPPR